MGAAANVVFLFSRIPVIDPAAVVVTAGLDSGGLGRRRERLQDPRVYLFPWSGHLWRIWLSLKVFMRQQIH